jgi:drug/metabolite transporter (DMT)-like permease
MSAPALFFIAVAIWGTTWIAITFQLPAAAAEVGVALRFSAAAAILLGYCAWRGIPLRLRARDQRWLALLGTLGFGLSYLLVYHAERFIVSGLVAVGYATMPLVNMVLARAFFATPMSRRVAVGGILGLAGVALIFQPEFMRLSSDQPLLIGAALTAGAVLVSSLANMIVARNQSAGVTGWAPLALAMGYGALASWIAVLVLGRPLEIRWSVPFVASLLYLALFGSVLAFGAYYALLGRIGPARASYVGVMATVVALAVSAAFEAYQWRWATALGIALAVAGNVLALHAPAPIAARTAPTPETA